MVPDCRDVRRARFSCSQPPEADRGGLALHDALTPSSVSPPCPCTSATSTGFPPAREIWPFPENDNTIIGINGQITIIFPPTQKNHL